MQVPAALSVDFEFFTHIPAYRHAPGTAETSAADVASTEWLLETFEAAEATATFFTVGEIADSHPDAVRRIVEEGHDLASHTQTHRHLSTLDAAERAEELAVSKATLEDATGASVRGFRAPSFDVAEDHFASLAEAGYAYDSSVLPARSIPGWYGGEFDVWRPSPATDVDADAPADLATVPVGVMPGLRLPLTGTWIRFFGVHYTLLGMRWLARRGIPPVLYVHPWELSDLPAVEGVPRRVYARTGSYMRRAVERILDTDFAFVSVDTLANRIDTGGARSAEAAE